MKVLVTGGAGFVDYNLALHLIGLGHEVIVLDSLSRKSTEIIPRKLPRCTGALSIR
ncbi:NAD-dependent epimerase/dehydratase family protein [Janthinobacterium lividum]